jgi:hypothetical protein
MFSRRSHATRRFHLERLEDRQLMAGDVTAAVYNGSLYLTEAAGQLGQNNAVMISQLPSGKIRVEGIGAPGAASLINGAAAQEFTVPGGLFVTFGAGQDRLEISPLSSTVRLASMFLNMGVASAAGDADKDSISLANFETTGAVTIHTGASNDHIFLSHGRVGDGLGIDRLFINSGAGGDNVHLRHQMRVLGDFEFQAFNAVGENDADTLYFNESAFVQKNLSARMGGGDDYFMVGDVNSGPVLSFALQVNGTTLVDAGAGADNVLIGTMYAGDADGDRLLVRTGAGADTVVLARVWSYGLEILAYESPLENDADHVLLNQAFVFGDVSAELGGGADHFYVTDPADAAVKYGAMINGAVYVDAGAGNDDVHIEGTSIGDGVGVDDLVIFAGAGLDKVLVDFTAIPLPNGGYLIPEAKGHVSITTYDALDEAERDEVRVPVAQIYRDLTVRTGAGDDFFELLGGNFGNLLVEADAGNDVGYLGGYVAHEAMVRMGDGADVLTLGHVNAEFLTTSGGNGVDRLYKTQPLAVDYLMESLWEYINGVPQWQWDFVWPGGRGGVLTKG